MKPVGFIYLTTCLVNGKIYIGRHEITEDKTRNREYLGSGTILKIALKKYGVENFKRKILRLCYNLHELKVWEHVYIVKYKSYDRKIGYNIADGDVNTTEYNPSKMPEVRRKIKERIKERGGLCGKNNPMYGKHWSEKKRKQMEEMFKHRHPMLGKHHSEETKKRWSEKRKGKHPFANLTPERRKEIYAKIAYKNRGGGTPFIIITNGIVNKRLDKTKSVPVGWRRGLTRKK